MPPSSVPRADQLTSANAIHAAPASCTASSGTHPPAASVCARISRGRKDAESPSAARKAALDDINSRVESGGTLSAAASPFAPAGGRIRRLDVHDAAVHEDVTDAGPFIEEA